MSITGEIAFYQRFSGKGRLGARFAKLIELTGADKAYIVTRSRWPFSSRDIHGAKLSNLRDEPYHYPIGEVLRIPRGIGALGAHLIAPDFGERVHEALKAEIPEAIRDQFAPGDPIVRMGWHLLDDLAPGHRGPDPSHRRAARLSLTLFGYGAPHNWGEYRARIWQTDIMRSLEAEITGAIGPVRRAISWSV